MADKIVDLNAQHENYVQMMDALSDKLDLDIYYGDEVEDSAIGRGGKFRGWTVRRRHRSDRAYADECKINGHDPTKDPVTYLPKVNGVACSWIQWKGKLYDPWGKYPKRTPHLMIKD